MSRGLLGQSPSRCLRPRSASFVSGGSAHQPGCCHVSSSHPCRAGAAAGAGGASVYFSGLGDSLRFVLDHGMGFSRGSVSVNTADKHYDELYRMVQQLSADMGRRQQGITIVHGNDSK